MTQLPLPSSSSRADTPPLSGNVSESEKGSLQDADLSPLLYSPAGPHGRLRAELMWVNKLLASDLKGSVSVISLRELKRALSAFAAEVRIQALGDGVPLVSLGAVMPSRSGGSTRATPGTRFQRTARNERRLKGR